MSGLSCVEFKKYLDAYLDDEFDGADRARFDAHVASCAECREHTEHQAWMRRSLRPHLRRPVEMPEAARARLLTRLRGAQRPARTRRVARRLIVPVPAVAAVGLFLLFTPLTGFAPVEEMVDQHCQELPVEVPTPEAVEVDQWFRDKLRFRVAAPRFSAKHAMLLGGRLTRISGLNGSSTGAGRDAAYLVYGVGRHKLTVLVFDGRDVHMAGGDTRTVNGHPVSLYTARGYRVAMYQRGALGYAVTSDLPEDQMVDLIATSL